jgi:hypothetical protein
MSIEIEKDILWSDPIEKHGEYPSRRGVGVKFGPDITDVVINRIGVRVIIRSHQPTIALSDPYYSHGGRVMTISSTSVYNGNPFYLEINNMDDDLRYEIKRAPVNHG